MVKFTVTRVIDGDTFEVDPQWEWGNAKGNRVRPTGYDAPEASSPGGQGATTKLTSLILGKHVELAKPRIIDRGRLICDVWFQGRNLASYFQPQRKSMLKRVGRGAPLFSQAERESIFGRVGSEPTLLSQAGKKGIIGRAGSEPASLSQILMGSNPPQSLLGAILSREPDDGHK